MEKASVRVADRRLHGSAPEGLSIYIHEEDPRPNILAFILFC